MYRVAVIGPGTMGRQIAADMLVAGYEVVLIGRETSEDPTRSVLKHVKRRGGEKDDMADFAYQTHYEGLENVSFVFEAVNEWYKTKFMVLKKADEVFGPHVPICTNTSSCNIKILEEALFNHPERFLAVHFFNPTSHLSFIEMTPTENTLPSTIQQAYALFEQTTFKIKKLKPIPGFVVNRLLVALVKEAFLIQKETGLSRSDIDQCCKAVLNCEPFMIHEFVGDDLMNIMSKNINGERLE